MHYAFQKLTVRRLISLLVGCVFTNCVAFAQQGESSCGPLANAFGPFDYRTERGNSLYLVESTHFLPYIEAVIRGHTSTTAGGDIDYTLRAFPNHHRALLSTIKLGEKEQTTKPQGMRYTIDCWFDRAIRFRPDDTSVRMIYATYLHKTKRTPEAVAQLENAASQAKDNPFTHHNIGLVYADIKVYDKALVQAHRAMALGFTRPDLRELLEKAGQWKDPEPAAEPAASPATSSASAASAAQ